MACSGGITGLGSVVRLGNIAPLNRTMPSSMIPDVLGQVVALYRAGQRDEAIARYERFLPLINYENKQCGLLAAKVLMKEGRIIAHDTVRHPLLPLHPSTRAGLLELAHRLDPLILRWSR